jgi:CheY-like chemotaxis protein
MASQEDGMDKYLVYFRDGDSDYFVDLEIADAALDDEQPWVQVSAGRPGDMRVSVVEGRGPVADNMGGPARILVVDDEERVGEMAAAMLEMRGHAVARACDARSTHSALADGAFDVAVIDVVLPGENGITLAEFVASQGIQVLLTSAYPKTMNWSTKRFPFLSKPFRCSALIQAVESLLPQNGRQAPA